MATETLAVTLLLQANQYKREARQAATATGQISNQATNAGTATGKLQGQMSGLATTAKFAVAGVATAAVAKFGKDSVQAFLGFDDAMNQSIAIMGDVSDSLRGDMEKAAREVGKTMRISAEEAAEAYFFLASAGLDAEQSIAAMPQVAAFAQAGMFDMATATDLATDAQSALGLSSDDAGQNLENLTRVTDVLTKANVLANTSVQQVAEAMTNRAGAAARALGIDVEEVAAVLAAFADQGTKGAEAGQQFGIVLRDLQTRALENKDAFEAAGISVFDSNEEFRNFADIIGDIEKRLGPMSDAQRRAELSTLGFNDRSIAALTTLLGTSDAIREYERELRKAGGTTQDIADKQMESFQGQMDKLKGVVEDVQITIGEALVPALIDLGETVIPLLEFLGLFAQGFTDVKNALGPLGDVLLGSPIGFILKSWNDLFGENEEKVKDVTEAVSTFSPELVRLENATAGAAAETENLVVAAEEAVEAEDAQAEATRRTVQAMADKRNALREIHNPLFAMTRRLEDLAEAQEEVEKLEDRGKQGTQEYKDAVLGRAEVIADLEQSLKDLQSQGIDPTGAAAREMLEGLGVPPEVINAIFAQFDALEADFEGRRFALNFSLPEFQYIRTGSNAFQPRVTSKTSIKGQHGGIALARPGGVDMTVAEAGSNEAVIPLNSEGARFMESVMGANGGGGGPTYNVFTLTWGDFVRKAADAGIEIQRYGW